MISKVFFGMKDRNGAFGLTEVEEKGSMLSGEILDSDIRIGSSNMQFNELGDAR